MNFISMTTKTTTLTAIFMIATLAFAIPGLGEAFATKTYATFWFAPTDDFRGVMATYEAEDLDNRDKWIAGPTWMRSTLQADLVEIGWMDENLTRDAYYYCGLDGGIEETWGSPSTGTQTTYYIYDYSNNGNIYAIGGGDYCYFSIGSYNIYKLEVGIEDSDDGNSVANDLKENLRWYDGSWNYYDNDDGSEGVRESHHSAEVDQCSSDEDVEIGDTASC